MKPYGKQLFLKKKASYESKTSSEKIGLLNINFLHQILDTINISLLVFISILFFLSFDSQRKWSNIYKSLSRTKAMNNNLIGFVSKTEEFYIGELESRASYRKTRPKDLIYLEKFKERKESFLKKNLKILIQGFNDSRYQKGY